MSEKSWYYRGARPVRPVGDCRPAAAGALRELSYRLPNGDKQTSRRYKSVFARTLRVVNRKRVFYYEVEVSSADDTRSHPTSHPPQKHPPLPPGLAATPLSSLRWYFLSRACISSVGLEPRACARSSGSRTSDTSDSVISCRWIARSSCSTARTSDDRWTSLSGVTGVERRLHFPSHTHTRTHTYIYIRLHYRKIDRWES